MLAIAGGKGGSGKTTTALGLARALANQGADPIVVDCDCDMPDLHHVVGLDRTRGVDEIATGASIERVSRRSTTVPGVRVVPAGSRQHVDRALRRIRSWHGPALLDCPPGIGPDAARPLRHADAAVLVTTDDPQALADTQTTARSARELGATVVGIVVREIEHTEGAAWPGRSPELSRVATVDDPLSHPQTGAAWAETVRGLTVCPAN